MNLKKLIFVVASLLSMLSYAQQKRFYTFGEETVEYSRFDYSKYGILHIYVTMFEENDQNKLLENNANDFLKKQLNLYHTLYFFIKVPSKYNFDQKEAIFNELMKEIEMKEGIKNYNLYLNFDKDYSDKYQSEISKNNLSNKIKRILIDVNSKNIHKGL